MLAMECSRSTVPPGGETEVDVKMLSGGYSGGDPPAPIPNTEVKPVSADGTWGGDPRESRTLPDAIVEGRSEASERPFLRFHLVPLGGKMQERGD